MSQLPMEIVMQIRKDATDLSRELVRTTVLDSYVKLVLKILDSDNSITVEDNYGCFNSWNCFKKKYIKTKKRLSIIKWMFMFRTLHKFEKYYRVHIPFFYQYNGTNPFDNLYNVNSFPLYDPIIYNRILNKKLVIDKIELCINYCKKHYELYLQGEENKKKLQNFFGIIRNKFNYVIPKYTYSYGNKEISRLIFILVGVELKLLDIHIHVVGN